MNGEPKGAANGSRHDSSSLSTSLPELIKDDSDRDFRQLIYNLLGLSNVMLRNRSHFGAFIGVTDYQFMVMTLLFETPGMMVTQIAQRLNVSSQSVTMETGKLIEKGIVEKRDSDVDRRRVELSLTQRGQALLHDVWPLRRLVNDITFSSLTAERAALLQTILSELLMGARNALHELQSPHRKGAVAPSLASDPSSEPSAKPAPRGR